MRRYNIPKNFEAGVNILGMTFKTRNLIEGVFLLVALFGATYYLTSGLSFDIRFTLSVFVSVPVAAIAVNGIHGDPLSTRIGIIYCYFQRKRSCFYNPRLKTEKSPMDLRVNAFNLLPRDKLNMIYDDFKSSSEKKQKELLNELNKDRQSGMFFQDDEGVVTKPYDYMTKKEQKAFDRDRKRSEKRARKEAKKDAKKRAKNQKKAG